MSSNYARSHLDVMSLEDKAPECGESIHDGSLAELIVRFSGAGRRPSGVGMDLLFPSNLCQSLLD
jgi:hypothetical protein